MNQQEICERGDTESREARDVCADVDQCHFIVRLTKLSRPTLPSVLALTLTLYLKPLIFLNKCSMCTQNISG